MNNIDDYIGYIFIVVVVVVVVVETIVISL